MQCNSHMTAVSSNIQLRKWLKKGLLFLLYVLQSFLVGLLSGTRFGERLSL